MSTTLTLDTIKTEQTRLAEMIAAFEAQASIQTSIHFPETLIELRQGEHCAGLIMGKDGEPSYYLILLPGEVEKVSWSKANEWAAKQGAELVAELPTRREQSLLYANLKEHFQPAWYWSCEQHASDSDGAWSQFFYYGGQHINYKSYEGRARAVRRLIIE